MKSVICFKSNDVINTFKSNETSSKLMFYRNSGIWNNVQLDDSGNILLD